MLHSLFKKRQQQPQDDIVWAGLKRGVNSIRKELVLRHSRINQYLQLDWNGY